MARRQLTDLQDMGESVMGIVAQVAGRRCVQILEEVYETQIKPRDQEIERLRAELRALKPQSSEGAL